MHLKRASLQEVLLERVLEANSLSFPREREAIMKIEKTKPKKSISEVVSLHFLVDHLTDVCGHKETPLSTIYHC